MATYKFTLMLRVYKALKKGGSLSREELFSVKYGTNTSYANKKNILNFFLYVGLIKEVKNHQGTTRFKLRWE